MYKVGCMENAIIKAEGYLDSSDIRAFLETQLTALNLQGQRVLALVPDSTRTMPLPEIITTVQDTLAPVVGQLNFMVALGTHPALSDAQLSKLFGRKVVEGKIGDCRIFNHTWDDPSMLASIGSDL